jgi:hypothetical protein
LIQAGGEFVNTKHFMLSLADQELMGIDDFVKKRRIG